jgi:HD-like signal output (HDOD) protein
MGGTGSVGFDDPAGLNDIVPQILDILLRRWTWPLIDLCNVAHSQDRQARTQRQYSIKECLCHQIDGRLLVSKKDISGQV